MRPTILFVDDNRNVRQFCKQELEADGYRVLLAGDGEDALDVLEHASVDAVVLDEHMPRCHGLEAARHIGDRFAGLPVILFTADRHFESYHDDHVWASVVKSQDLDPLKRLLQLAVRQQQRNSAAGNPPTVAASGVASPR